ncbi:hypothetical protein [Alkalicoccus daliensis]|uniref:Uncharacterized protein n=1 Tax=Alkalicoccus daliensis TaxID=745820 RepID=A0A1H0CSA9_9BACI|nr:hypothetical protein [Alkalicoccus daliensis]SDN60777.1 hypothetical protein SAMN04488053_102213 [Alkalicoccus daliensis]
MKMKHLLLAAALISLAACANNEDGEEAAQQDEERELESLRESEAALAEQLEEERERTSELEERVEDLYEENMQLKDDLLTYKQDLIDRQAEHEQELAERQELDDTARQLFQAMHERDTDLLAELLAEEVQIDSDAELLTFTRDEMERSFHFLQLERVNFVRQRSLEVNEGEAVAEYEFYDADEEELYLDGAVEVSFEQIEENDWSVVYVQFIN